MRPIRWGVAFLLLLGCVPASHFEEAMTVVVMDGGADSGTDLDSGTALDAGADAGLPEDGGLPPAHAPLPAGRALQHERFATGQVCGECHGSSASSTALRDALGQPLGLVEPWSATAMANSVRDPLFRAALANEVARAPAAGDTIASVCLTCHAPMGRHAQLAAGQATTPALPYATTNEGTLARDGVSCTACHQVQPTNLGQASSFSGGFEFDGSRRIFGPYANPFAMPMVNRVNYTPTQGLHVQSSALCGTYHTLITEALDPDGTPHGHQMGEQLTYLAWRRSAFTTEGGGTTPSSCQACHLPDQEADGGPVATMLAHRPDGTNFPSIGPRSPFSRHTFVGANTLLPRLLRDGRALLNPPASDALLLGAEQLARDNLASAAARVTVTGVQRQGDRLQLAVHLENLTGHKFLTGYPSRRAVLELRVLDAAGATLFQVGGFGASGRVVDAAGAVLASERAGGGFRPHRTTVQSGDDVVIYEAVMHDGAGGPSYDSLGAEGFVKDNRLLPRGHADATTGPSSTAPVGVSDADFGPGGDVVPVDLQLSGTPARVEVRLWYQVFSPRYLDELLARPTPEATALRAMLSASALQPEPVAAADVNVP